MSIINLLIITPLIAILFNIFKIPTPFVWYAPNFVILIYLIKEIMSKKIDKTKNIELLGLVIVLHI